MANDYMKKQPTKNEQMFYELIRHQDNMQHSLWTTSAFLTSVAMLLNIEPEKIAELMVNGNDKIKEYSQKINQEIDRLETAKKETTHEHHDHDHSGSHEHK